MQFILIELITGRIDLFRQGANRSVGMGNDPLAAGADPKTISPIFYRGEVTKQ
jgi:hypothetical protein